MTQNDSSTSPEGADADFGLASSAAPGVPPVSAGTLVRIAREKAGVAAAKVSADLRIAPATLAALEAGDYSKLAGPPYVRAMLVSLSRYLRLDSREVLKAYSEEGGIEDAAPATVSPYKDDSSTHAKAHKQIFILILAVLLFILLLIMGKVNTSSPETEPEAPPAAADTLLNLEPAVDSALSDSLSDSLNVNDSAAVADTTAQTDKTVKTDTIAKVAPGNPETRVRVVALTDSVWLRVLPAGARESSRYLRLDKPVDFRHDDAITFITRKGSSIRVTAGDQEQIPTERRFKVDGDQITE